MTILLWILFAGITLWAATRIIVALFIMFMMSRDQSGYFDDDDQF